MRGVVDDHVGELAGEIPSDRRTQRRAIVLRHTEMCPRYVAKAVSFQIVRQVRRGRTDVEGDQPLELEPVLPIDRAAAVQDADFERFWTSLLQRGGWWDTAAAPPAPAQPTTGGAAAPGAGLPQATFDGGAEDYPYHLLVYPHNTLGTGGGAPLPWLQAAPDPLTSVVWQTWVEVNPTLAQTAMDAVTIRAPRSIARSVGCLSDDEAVKVSIADVVA